MCKYCNVLICQNCIDRFSETNQDPTNIKCYDCKNILQLSEIQKITQKGLNMIHVRCPSQNINCIEEFTLKEVYKHLEKCKFFPGKSKCNYCHVVEDRKNIEQHFDTCVNYPAECRYCEEEFQRNQLYEHELKCLSKPTNCRTCKIKFAEGEEIKHETTKDQCMLNYVRDIVEALESKLILNIF